MLHADVAVVGGGPAGAATAIHLARAGRDVVVLDRARFPRDKCCGDGLTTLALRLLERIGFQPSAVPSWTAVQAAQVRAPDGRTVEFPLPSGSGAFAAVVPRLELDHALLDLARAAGAEVHDGHGIAGARPARDHVDLDAEGLDTVRARYAIGADGMWSPLRRHLGAAQPGYRGEWHAFRQYVDATGPAARQLWVWFEPDLLPGYAWSFPLPDGRANVGFGVARGARLPGADLAATWDDLLQRPHVVEVLGPAARPVDRRRAWPIPARVDQVPLWAASGRALFVGDAAAAADPLTGEGIGQALLTGMLAADAVLAAGARHPGRAGATYERTVLRALRADHRMSVLLSKVLRSQRAGTLAIGVAGASPWTRRHFGRWLFEDEPRAVLATPRRWHRHLLARPGAFRSAA